MKSITVEPPRPVPGKLVYLETEYSFATKPRPATCGASLCINELELMLDDEKRQQVVFVEGYCPSPAGEMRR